LRGLFFAKVRVTILDELYHTNVHFAPPAWGNTPATPGVLPCHGRY
jgi:hypothetical protein